MRPDPRERGVALILVLVILPLVAIIMTQLSFETAIGDRLASNALANQQFILAIRARETQMRLRLVRDLKDDEKNAGQEGGAYDHYGDLWGPDHEGGQTAVSVRKGDKDSGDEITLYTEVSDEQGKFNINLLTHKDEARAQRARETFRNLLNFYRDEYFKDMERNSWDLDPHEANQVAESVYKFLRGEKREGPIPLPPAEIPDPTTEMKQAIHSVRDLIFADSLFVEKRLLERFTDVETGQTIPSLEDFITIHGDGKVNVNTAKIQVLRAMFKDEHGQRVTAADILHGRGGFLNTMEDQDRRREDYDERKRLEEEGREDEQEVQAYRSLNDLTQVEGMGDTAVLRQNEIDVARDFTVRTNFFLVIITAQRENYYRQPRRVRERRSRG